jgi:hypothetical protein
LDRSELAHRVARRLGDTAHPSASQVADAVAVFAPLGWVMCRRWHVQGTLTALRRAADGATSIELDELITDTWNTDNKTWLRDAAAPMRVWSNSHRAFKRLLWNRVGLIEKAIEHHEAGAYEATIPIVLAQVDGMTRDLTGTSFFSKANHDPYIDDTTLAGMETNLPVVRAVFSADIKESGHHGSVSRHGVLHGRDLGYATRVNSTKTIVLVTALAEYLPRVADETGMRLRAKHEDDVTRSRELDELGRLRDDRRVPQVHRFAWDFDIAYARAVLMRTDAFDGAAQRTRIATEHGLNPADFTVGSDDVGWWWHITLPAGNVLGYAACPSTNAERRHPDVWRWDQPTPPPAPPWRAQRGWRSDDDFPRSANWEPKIVN